MIFLSISPSRKYRLQVYICNRSLPLVPSHVMRILQQKRNKENILCNKTETKLRRDHC
jgi:hypothetical protein